MATTVVPGLAPPEGYLGVCATDPERWTTGSDGKAKALCRICARRWLCAREAWETPRAEGLWAGVVIPESGRGRDFALRQLRSLAEFGGYPVRQQCRFSRRLTESPDDQNSKALRLTKAMCQPRSHGETQQLLSGDQALLPGWELAALHRVPKP